VPELFAREVATVQAGSAEEGDHSLSVGGRRRGAV